MKIGIDLGGSHVSCGLVEKNALRDCIDFDYKDEDKENLLDAIIDYIEEGINYLLSNNDISWDEVELIGIASPGTISGDIIVKAGNLGIENFDIINRLKPLFPGGITYKIRNDGKCAALAEKQYGALKKYDDAIFINVGTGIGGAVFMNGNLLEPKRFSGFELGHMIIQKDGIDCTCGKKGCFERYCSIKALKTRILKELELDNIDCPGQKLREEIIPSHYYELKNIVNDYVDNMVIGLGNLIDIFEPEAICFGGSFSYWEGTDIYRGIKRKLNRPGTTFNSEKPKIVAAKLRNNAGIVGATL